MTGLNKKNDDTLILMINIRIIKIISGMHIHTILHDLYILTKSYILLRHIGQSLKFLLHLIHAVLCLHGMYTQSLSFSKHIMHAFGFVLSLTIEVFILHVYVWFDPNLNTNLSISS